MSQETTAMAFIVYILVANQQHTMSRKLSVYLFRLEYTRPHSHTSSLARATSKETRTKSTATRSTERAGTRTKPDTDREAEPHVALRAWPSCSSSRRRAVDAVAHGSSPRWLRRSRPQVLKELRGRAGRAPRRRRQAARRARLESRVLNFICQKISFLDYF